MWLYFITPVFCLLSIFDPWGVFVFVVCFLVFNELGYAFKKVLIMLIFT